MSRRSACTSAVASSLARLNSGTTNGLTSPGTRMPSLSATTDVGVAIPFNRVSIQGNEDSYVRDAMVSGHISGDGPFTRRCNEFLQELHDLPRALLTTSCTHALEL